MSEINTRIKLKRDTESNWGLKNPVILNGELILVDMAEGGIRAKIGDGSSTYSALPFADEELRGLIGDTPVSEQIDSAVSSKMDKENPTGSGNVSFGRKSGTTIGSNSVVIGSDSQATTTNTIAIGSGVTASNNNSIAIGASTTASGENSVAIGVGATASGVKSLVLGDHNVASGEYATAMGCWTNAPGTAAISLGNGTNANGWGAMASGIVTNAKGLGQHVFGSYNIPDDDTIENYYDTSEHLIIVGNGDVLSDDGVQSNAHTLDWDGNAWFAGDVYVGSTSGTNKDSGSKKLATVEELNDKSDSSHTHDNATTTTAGLMSAADKSKLDSVATGATKVDVDSVLSSTSTNPVQNKVVHNKFNDMVGDTPVSEQISAHATSTATQGAAGHMSAADKIKLDNLVVQLGGYTIKYQTTVPTVDDTSVITLVPRG